MCAVLGRVIRHPEKCFRKRGRRLGTIGYQPGFGIAQTVAPIVGRAIERKNIKAVFDQRDERQKQLAVKAILIQVIGSPVRCCDNRDACGNQSCEQPRHDRCIGHVVDDHFVKTEQPGFIRKCRDHGRNRIAFLFFALNL